MNKLKRIDLYTIPLFIVAAAVVTLRTVALFTSFNSLTMHFDNKVAITISGILVAIAVIGFGSYLFLGEKERKLLAKSDNARSYIPAGLVSIAMVFLGAECLSLSLGGRYPVGPLPALSIACALLAFLSAVSFFLSVFIERSQHLYKAAFSLSVVFCLAIWAIILFFDKQTHPTNSPNKLVDQFAYISAALFFLFESRIPLGRAKWRGYVATGLVATLLCTYSSVPSLILYAANGYVVSHSIIESVLTLAMAIFICSKVLQTRSLTPACECDAAKSISALAALRREEIEENRKSSRAHAFNNNVENDDAEDTDNYTFDIPEAEISTDFAPDGSTADDQQ